MTKHILVTGDPICDHNYYKGNRPTADSDEPRGFRSARVGGGALLLKKLIHKVMETAVDAEAEEAWEVEFGLNDDFRTLPSDYHSFCIWEPVVGTSEEDSKNPPEFWRALDPPLGYGHKDAEDSQGSEHKRRANAYDLPLNPCSNNPGVVVIDDAGIGFREAFKETLCPSLYTVVENSGPAWVVLKLTGQLESNALWEDLITRCKENLVVIVPANELRRREVRLSRGLSWEATAEDLTAELYANPRLAPLLQARHLIVTFQSDAAYWLDNAPEAPRSMLVFDALRAEGEWMEAQGRGGAFGFLSCFTAALVKELCLSETPNKPDIEAALGAGLGAGRELLHVGHGSLVEAGKELHPGFPFDRISARINAQIHNPNEKFVSASIPHKICAKDAEERYKRGHWMMLDEWQVHAHHRKMQRPHYDAAMAVAVLGPEALERFPVAQFGSYQTVDRKEIESLRTIRQLINNYTKVKKQKTPLNLGVFGPPGSGKSYIVLEIAEAVGIKKEDVKIFNLSQFSDPADLFGAFHQIRDKILTGSMPLIFWDEFDAQGYRWLQYLLAPMEDGEFQEGQITHPIGKCIFVFAGATSSTFDKFGPCNPDLIGVDPQNPDRDPVVPPEVEKSWRAFVLAKGPDFKSRLVGYLNILGVNPRLICEEKAGRRIWKEDVKDLYFPIRRALFMRALLKAGKGDRLKLDPSVIRALLEMPKYKGGGRSLQFLCTHLKNSSETPGRSDLPGYELLDMHVKAELFWELCEQDMEFAPAALALAKGLHQDWLDNIKPEQGATNSNAKSWEELDPATQGSNVAQAARIPSIVALAGFRVVRGEPLSETEAAQIGKTLQEHAEVLAEAEHNGWMIERMLAGWRYARLREKDPENKLHPLLIPYTQLHEIEQDKDRRVIQGQNAGESVPEIPNYVERLERVGFRIVPA